MVVETAKNNITYANDSKIISQKEREIEKLAISYYQTRLRAHVKIIISRVNNLCIHDSACKKERAYVFYYCKHETEKKQITRYINR